MKPIYLITTLLILLQNVLMAQNEKESWDSYLASYENKKPGSTVVRMDLINNVPIKEYKFILISGVTYKSDDTDGFPDNKTLEIIQQIGDELGKYIHSKFNGIYVGSFMHNFERLEYFYLKDNTNVKEIVTSFYDTKYPQFKSYVNIKDDSQWTYYKDFLYPNEDIQNYMGDQKVVDNLTKNGDDLTKSRRVDHWVYIDSKQNAETFKIEVEKLGYKIEEIKKDKENRNSYKVNFWKDEFVDLGSINQITSNLRVICKKYNGVYDGWETFVIKK